MLNNYYAYKSADIVKKTISPEAIFSVEFMIPTQIQSNAGITRLELIANLRANGENTALKITQNSWSVTVCS